MAHIIDNREQLGPFGRCRGLESLAAIDFNYPSAVCSLQLPLPLAGAHQVRGASRFKQEVGNAVTPIRPEIYTAAPFPHLACNIRYILGNNTHWNVTGRPQHRLSLQWVWTASVRRVRVILQRAGKSKAG